MVKTVDSLLIDDTLRFALFGLECALNVEFNPAAVETVFADAYSNQRSPKEYTFWSASTLRVTGQVDDYEPETLWLQVESTKEILPPLQLIIERAKYQALRMRRSSEAHPPADS
jgi:hypothetical protein